MRAFHSILILSLLCSSNLFSINVDIVDIDILVFKNHPDPHSLFPFRRKNHYNALGYKLVAEEISKYLLRNKIIK